MPKPFISSAGSAAGSDPRLASSKKLSAILLSIAEWLSFAAVIVVPLVFLTATSQSLEFPKQLALFVLVGLAALCWTGAMLINRSVLLRRSVANPIVLILIATTLISSLASGSRYAGIIGAGGQEYQSLVTLALFVALFFVVVNIPEKRAFGPRAIFASVIVGGVASLYVLLQFAGVHIIPGVNAASFNLIGSTVVMGLYAAVISVLAAAWFLNETAGKMILVKRIVVGVSGLLALFTMVVIDFWPVWVAAIVGFLAILIYAMVRPHAIRRLSWLAIPMIVLVFAVLMVFVNIPMPLAAPTEVFPSFSQSLSVARDSLFSHPIFGSGPGTYVQAFALHRSEDLNKSILWYVQFDRGMSFLTTIAVTTGLAGLVAWLAVIVVGIWKSAAYLIAARKKEEQSWVMTLVISTAWLASAAGLVLYGASFASLFLFWLLLALVIRATSPSTVEVKFDASPRAALGMTFVFVVLVVLALAGWFVNGTRFVADNAFVRGVTINDEAQIDKTISLLEGSMRINPRSDVVARNLSQAYLIKIRQLFNDSKLDATVRGEKIQALTSSAIKAGQLAVALSPKDSQNWMQMGAVYEAITSYVSNAPNEAIIAYNKAAELYPTSPIYPTAVGRIFLALANRGNSDLVAAKDDAEKVAAQKTINDNLDSAVISLNKALSLKSDYAEAAYQLALALDARGKTKEAITRLEAIQLANSGDAGVAFELGLLYYRDGQKDKAVSALQTAVAISTTFDNARWLMTTILEEQKKWDEAITQVNEILKRNPDNEVVKEKLKTLEDARAGKAPATPTDPSVLP